MKTAPPSLDTIVTLDNMSQLAHFFVAMFLVEHLSRWLGHSHWIWFGWVVALAAQRIGHRSRITNPPRSLGTDGRTSPASWWGRPWELSE